MADIKLSDENVIKVNLSVEGTINANVQDVNYVPGYVEAEQERRANELQRIANESSRISNEEEREQYILDLKERVEKGEFNGKDGDKGDKGDKGDQGEKGDKGDKGEQGIQGNKGEDGAIHYTAGEGIEITDDNVINCLGGGATVTYIDDNSSSNPFVLEEHDPGTYVFKTQPYVKARTSNTSQTLLGTLNNVIYLLRKPLTDDPDNTVVASYMTSRLLVARVELYSTTNSGISISQTNNSPEFVSKTSSEKISGTKTFYNLPKLNDEVTPTNDLEFTTKKYVDDVVANAGETPVTYISLNSAGTPFVFEEHEPGVYVFSHQPYVKAKTSNTGTNLIPTADNTIYLLKKPLADDPDNTIVASYMTNSLDSYRIKLSSTYNHGVTTEGSSNGRAFVHLSLDEKIDGNKTFVNLPKLKTEKTPTNDLQLATKKYVDDSVLETYSETETVIGTFIGKPLYRKMYNITGGGYLSNTGYTDIQVVNLYGYITGEKKGFVITYMMKDCATVLEESIEVIIPTGLENPNGYAIVEYTKTTDE